MAVTLADVNETLLQVEDNTDKTSRGLSSFVEHLRVQKRKSLEQSREAKNVNAAESARQASSGGGQGTTGEGGGLIGGVKTLLAGATLAKLVPKIGGLLLKRILLPATIATFADDIVEFLLPEGFENDVIKDALTGGLQGAAIGFAVGGPLGAAIGAGIGALLTNENFKKNVKELGKNLKQMGEDLYEKIEPTVINFKNNFLELFDTLGITKEGIVGGLAGGIKFVGDAAANAVGSLNKILVGDFENLGKDIGNVALFVGGLIGILKVGKIAKLLKKLAVVATGAAGAAIISAFKKDSPDVDTKPKPDVKSSQPKPGSVNPKTGNIIGVDGKDTAVKGSSPGAKKLQTEIQQKATGSAKTAADVPKKFGRFLKFLRFPGIAQLMATTEAFQILSSDISINEKKRKMGGVLGGLLGSGAGTFIGGAIGSVFPGPGTALGALIGGIGGYIGGDYFGNKLANFLFEDQQGGKPAGSDAMRMGRGGPTQTFSKPSDAQRRAGPDVITSAATMQGNLDKGKAPKMENTSIVANSGNSTTNNINNTSTGLLMGKPDAIDNSNPILQRVAIT